MAAATTESVGAVQLASTDIEEALCLSVSEALCAAATGTPFLPEACAQAAKAYKHDAFASRLSRHVDAAERVSKALTRADHQVAHLLALKAPKAHRFIDEIGPRIKPQYTQPAQAGGRGTLTAGPKGAVKSRQAGAMAALWTLRFALKHYGQTSCALAKEASYEAVAALLGTALSSNLEATAKDIRDALAFAAAIQQPELPKADGPAAKRQRR